MSRLLKLVTINIAGPACFLITYLVGLAFRFDGQAAILTLPFVLMGWGCSIFAIVVSITHLLRPSENSKTRTLSVLFILGYGLLFYLLIPKNR